MWHLNDLFRENLNEICINIFSTIISENPLNEMTQFFFNHCLKRDKEIENFTFDLRKVNKCVACDHQRK